MRSPDAGRLADLLAGEGGGVTRDGGAALTVTNLDAARIGELAAGSGLVLHELTPHRGSLEQAFLDLTHDSVEYANRGSS